MSDNTNPYDFPQTTTTLIDRLRVGGKEDWTEFWKRYEGPIKNTLKSIIRKKGQQLDYDEAEAYIGVVFQRIQDRFHTYVHHGRSQFRSCILTWVGDVIVDEMRRGKREGWKNTSLTLDSEVESDEGEGKQRIDNVESDAGRRVWCKGSEDVSNEEQSIKWELRMAIVKEARIRAANRFPWGENRKKIVRMLANNTDLSVGEIAKRCNTTSQNVSKAKAALDEKAKPYFDIYKSDDCGFWDELYSRFRLSGLNIDEAEKIIAAQIESMSDK